MLSQAEPKGESVTLALQIQNKINLKDLEITDPRKIDKYMRMFTDFYIPASEHDTFDTELLESDILYKSSEVIGQKNPIEVAICENDKNPESNPFHIHLRIIDGRHRWKQAIKHKVTWATKFYEIKDYQQYMTLRGHFDSKKRITQEERIEYFEKLGKYYEDVLHIPNQKICQMVIKDYSPPFNEATIRRYMPQKYKEVSKQKGCYASVHVRHPTSLKQLQEKKPEYIRNDYSRFRFHIEQLETENDYLRGEIGSKQIFGDFFILEELQGNSWNFIHCRSNESIARQELNWLNPAKYRLRKVKHISEIIYKETNDKDILKARNQAEYGRKHYESRKFASVDKKNQCIVWPSTEQNNRADQKGE